MKKAMKMIVSLVLAVMFLALLGCRNETETAKPKTTQDAYASQTPTATEQPTEAQEPTQTPKPLHAVKPGQPYFASLKHRSSFADTFSPEEKEHYLPLLDEHDLNAVRTFLEIKDKDGVRNGIKMNEWYSPDDPTTWFYTPVSNEDRYMEEGYRGYVDLVEWSDGNIISIQIEPFIQKCYSYVIGFVGELDLSNCKSLEYAIINGNNIETINFEGCEALFEAYITDTKSLETLNVTGTNIYRFQITNAINLKTVLPSPVKSITFSTSGCGLKQIDWICTYLNDTTGKDYFHVKLSTEGAGSVYTSGDDEDVYWLSVSAVPEEGHRFIGWYDADGKLVSTDEHMMLVGDDHFLEIGSDVLFEFVAKFE